MRLYTFRTTPPPPPAGLPPVPVEMIPTASVVAESDTAARVAIISFLNLTFGLDFVSETDAPEGRAPGVIMFKRPDGVEEEAQRPTPPDFEGDREQLQASLDQVDLSNVPQELRLRD